MQAFRSQHTVFRFPNLEPVGERPRILFKALSSLWLLTGIKSQYVNRAVSAVIIQRLKTFQGLQKSFSDVDQQPDSIQYSFAILQVLLTHQVRQN